MSAIKSAIIFLTGAATGATVTYFAVKEKFKKQAADDIAEARKTFREMRNNETVTDAPEEYYEDEAKDKKSEKIDENNSKEKGLYREVLQKTNYGAMSKEPEVKEVLDEPKKIYQITEEEYNTIDNYEKQTLDYYEEDGTLVDENGDIVSVEDYIGNENLAHLSDEETLFIRHESTAIDYEVVLYHMSYATANGDFLEDDLDDE